MCHSDRHRNSKSQTRNASAEGPERMGFDNQIKQDRNWMNVVIRSERGQAELTSIKQIGVYDRYMIRNEGKRRSKSVPQASQSG